MRGSGKPPGGRLARETQQRSWSIALCLERREGTLSATHVSKAIERYGYSRKDFVGGPLDWDSIVHPEDRDLLREARQTGEDSYTACYRILTADGREVWMSDVSQIIRDEAGQAAAVDSIVTDYIQADDMLHEIECSMKRQSVLMEILECLHGGNITHAINTILERTCRYFNFRRAVILMDNSSCTAGQAIYEWCGNGVDTLLSPGLRVDYRQMKEVGGHLRSAGRCIVTQSHCTPRVIGLEEPVISLLFTVCNNGQRYGILILDESREQRVWGVEDIQFLEHIAELVSTEITQKEQQEALRKSQEQIHMMAFQDSLTKLPNRYCFDRMMEGVIAGAVRKKRQGYALLIDMDDFKRINDGYGHDIGDQLLLRFSSYLQERWGERHPIFRLGSDEFLILIEGDTAEYVQALIGRILDQTKAPWEVSDHCFYCTISMGVVRFPDHGDNVRTILQHADLAMHQAKLKGKSCCVHYTRQINNNSIELVEMERMLRDAIANNYRGFEPYYQPIVYSDSERIKGVEALIRWQDPDGRFVSPGQFIPLAEHLGLIVPIGDYMLREAVKLCRTVNDMGRQDFTVSVNVSARQLQRQDFVTQVASIIEESGVRYGNIILEVTEGLPLTDLKNICTMFDELRALGIQIAIDDFGTGYSSLSYLRDMPIDIIKIDRAFIRDITVDAYSHTFVRVITELGHTLGNQVCIEGVETEEQLALCKQAGADLIQGFLFYRATPEKDFVDILLNNMVRSYRKKEIRDAI